MNLTVNEIFYSIQGESVHAGLPCTFVRLTGCNLRCSYCDTRYAFEEGQDLSLNAIIEQINAHGCSLVEITGGEPLLQVNTPVLARRLLDQGYDLLMETNGSLDIDRVDRRCSRIMDIKCPSSGQHQSMDAANIDRLTPIDQVKFVVADRQDFDFAAAMAARLPARLPAERILFSAVAGQLPHERLAAWMLEARLAARMQVQLHKIIWPDEARGV